MQIKSYRKTSALFLCGLLSVSMSVKKSYAVARCCTRIKQLLPKKSYPKSHHYGWATALPNSSAAFSTPPFKDLLSRGSPTVVDPKKINFAMVSLSNPPLL